MRDELPRRFVLGDPIRAVGALAVFLQHVSTILIVWTPAVRHPLHGSWGAAGSWLWNLNVAIFPFFVLSGYLIGRPFLRWLLDVGRRPELVSYARNRALRIIPAFLGAYALVLIVFRPQATADQLLSVPLLLGVPEPSVLGVYTGLLWSVHVEAVFYVGLGVAFLLLAPLLIRLPRPARLGTVLAVCLAVLTASAAARLYGGQAPWNRQEAAQTIFGFMPGVMLAALEPVLVPWLRRVRWARLVPLSLAGAAVLGWIALVSTGEQRVLVRTAAYVAVAGGGVGAALSAQWLGRRPSRIFDRRALHWLGERSYSFYLLHYTILLLLTPLALKTGNLQAGAAVLVALGLPLTLALAAASFRWLERPFLQRRARPEVAGGLTPAAYP